MENFWNSNNFVEAFSVSKSPKGFHSELGLNSRYIKPPKTKELNESCLKYADAKKLAADIKIKKGDRFFVIVNGSFYFGDFIEALIVKNNYHVKKMVVSTLSLNENNVDSFANLLNADYVDELDLIVSDYFFAHERQNLIPYLYRELDKGNKFQLAVAGTHCKMCIFETWDGEFICIHGSANLRSSSNIEQIVLEENKFLYDFNFEYQSRIIKHYKTIDKQKPLRGEKLWHQVQGNTQESTQAEQPAPERENRAPQGKEMSLKGRRKKGAPGSRRLKPAGRQAAVK